MNRTVRSVATSLAVGFAMYFAARGVWWIEQPSAPLLMVAAIALYLVVVGFFFVRGLRSRRPITPRESTSADRDVSTPTLTQQGAA